MSVQRTKASTASTEEHMLGHGYYNKNSHSQNQANAYALPVLVKAVHDIELDRVANCLQIADYGSAQGVNSLKPVKTAIAEIKSRVQETRRRSLPSILVTHTDLPTNDWSTLFTTVLNSPESYMVGESNVFVSAAATSIYQQIFPAASISLGYSAIAVHWLSRKPCNIPGHIWSARTMGQIRSKWAEQARLDWRSFLKCRAAELLSSGQLVIVGSGADDQGNSGAESLMDLANNVLKELAKEHILEQCDLDQICIPTYYRTRSEWKEPFGDPEFVRSIAMELVKCEEIQMPDVYLDQYHKSSDEGAFAEAYARFFKAAYEPCLFTNLKQRTPNRQPAIDEFFRRLQDGLADDPKKYSCHWMLSIMQASKL